MLAIREVIQLSSKCKSTWRDFGAWFSYIVCLELLISFIILILLIILLHYVWKQKEFEKAMKKERDAGFS